MIPCMKEMIPENNRLKEASIPDLCAKYSAVTAVLGVLFTWFDYPDGIFIGFVFAVAAFMLGSYAKKNGSSRGSAVFGMIFGIIGALFCAFLYFGLSAFYSIIRDPETSRTAFDVIKQLLDAYGLSPETFVQMMSL